MDIFGLFCFSDIVTLRSFNIKDGLARDSRSRATNLPQMLDANRQMVLLTNRLSGLQFVMLLI